MPLDRLWNDDGEIAGKRERFLSKPALHEMLRRSPVQFFIAEIGCPLRRIDVTECYAYWKSEAAANIVHDPESRFFLEDFPGEYALLASEWSGVSETPIVLLEKHH